SRFLAHAASRSAHASPRRRRFGWPACALSRKAAVGASTLRRTSAPPTSCPSPLIPWRIRHALPAETDLLPSLDAERALAQDDREPLREQLWRGAAAPEHHHRAARVARLGENARPRDQRPEARGADRAQFDAPP